MVANLGLWFIYMPSEVAKCTNIKRKKFVSNFKSGIIKYLNKLKIFNRAGRLHENLGVKILEIHLMILKKAEWSNVVLQYFFNYLF